MENTRSLRWNAAANFVALGYTTAISIIVFPLYLQYLGSEAFGLVGFFLVLQAWMQLLDMGMSPLLSRQTAQARGGHIEFIELRKTLRSLEIIIFAVSAAIVLGITISSEWIATTWLDVSSLHLEDVIVCIVLMGATTGVRLISALYRSGIQGMENQVRLNICLVLLTTARFVGALIILHFITQDIVFFFTYQLVIGLVELGMLSSMLYALLPAKDKLGFRVFPEIIRPLLPFAGSLAYSVAIWILLTQLDKLILSNVLPLSEFGYFSLVAVVATGISQLSGPISQAILPRMTYLLSQNNDRDMLALYRKSTQLIAIIVLPLTGVIALFATELLLAWTGNRAAADWAGPILFWLALGNGILTINAFQYYLQFAHGKLKTHVIYNTILAIIQIPLIIYIAITYGALAVAQAWFALRLATFLLWTPIVHHMLAPGVHFPWLAKEIAPTLIIAGSLLIFIRSLDIEYTLMSRPELAGTLAMIALATMTINMLFSSESRKFAITMIHTVKQK